MPIICARYRDTATNSSEVMSRSSGKTSLARGFSSVLECVV